MKWLLALFAVAAGLFALGEAQQKKVEAREEKKLWTSIAEFVVIDAQKSRVTDDWWIRTTPPASLETKALFEGKKSELVSLIARYREVSDKTRNIAARFTEFRLAILIRNKPEYLMENGVVPPLTTNGLNVCFLSEEDARRNVMYFTAWQSDMNIMFMLAMNFPEKIQASIFLHELAHALRHNWLDSGGKPAPSSDTEIVREEVEMHQFSGEILDYASNGLYFRRINEILLRSSKESRLPRVLALITTEDRQMFDAMFECDTTETPKKYLASNYVRMLGFRYAERRGLGLEGKIDMFKEIEKNLIHFETNNK
ncbi:MAG: hypothetical protein Q7R93_02610 [bacterium]|nr:hypothetical protein [bacterium]